MKSLMLTILLISSIGFAKSPESKFKNDRFTINFQNTPLREALTLIASKSNLSLKSTTDLQGDVTFAIHNSTLEEAMQTITTANGLTFAIQGHSLVVSRRAENDPIRSTANVEDTAAATAVPLATNPMATNQPGDIKGFEYRSIPISYTALPTLVTNLQKSMQPGESIISDESNNAIIVFSSLQTFEKARRFVSMYDKRPLQVLIEAQIVEATKSFARSLGISWGDTAAAAAPAPSIGIINPGPGSPNLAVSGLIGTLNGKTLEARLLAGESNGEAKIVSRPKVFTLNNKKATIHSGITYNVKTLSAMSTGTAGTTGGGTVTGGVTSITSGLELDVTPSVVGEGSVKLVVKVSNSEPDAGSSVDGIPGINDNSADTSVIIKNGQTATLAGLVKKSISHTQQGVPWLSRVPLIGWLFSANNHSDVDSELIIFLTPHVLEDNLGSQPPAEKPAEEKPAAAAAGTPPGMFEKTNSAPQMTDIPKQQM